MLTTWYKNFLLKVEYIKLVARLINILVAAGSTFPKQEFLYQLISYKTVGPVETVGKTD